MFSCKWKNDGSEDVPNPYEGYDEFDEENTSDEDMDSENYFVDITSEDMIFSCDTCERDFPNEDLFNKHMSEHRVCGIDECTFTAHEKIIEKHIRMQHSTGLYDKIRNLNTPEDIANWLKERKAKYPSKDNVDKRYQQQEELLKRGVKIGERNNRFGKDKTRLTRTDPKTRQEQREKFLKKKNDKVKREVKRFQPKSLIDEKLDWNGNMFPFRGTTELYAEEEESKISDFEDEEWDAKPSNVSNFFKVNASLGALIGAYGSDATDEEEIEIKSETTNTMTRHYKISEPISDISVEKTATSADIRTEQRGSKDDLIEEMKIETDDEAPPLEMKIERTNPNLEDKEVKGNSIKENPKVRKRNRKRKTFSDKKQNSFTKKHKASKDNFPYNNFKKRKITLLERLLDKDIRQERNTLLQCVKYVVNNNFFRGEKTRRGRVLRRLAVPSQNLPKSSAEAHDRHTQADLHAAETLLELLNSTSEITTDDINIVIETSVNENCEKVCDSEVQVNTYKINTLADLLTTDNNLNSFTGLNNFQILNCLEEMTKSVYNDTRIHRLSIRKRIILTMVKLKLDLSYVTLAVLFNISRQLCKNYFFDMLPVLSGILKTCIYIPSEEEISRNLPYCFRDFPGCRKVLDCTEISVQKPTCLCCRIKFYSQYKRTTTVKFMTGVSPAEIITFISDPYGGRASDKIIFEESNLVTKLSPNRDSTMVDKGFLIDDVCAQNKIKLIRPPFLRKKKQLSSEEAQLNQRIAMARVHIERSNQRLKIFKIIRETAVVSNFKNR